MPRASCQPRRCGKVRTETDNNCPRPGAPSPLPPRYDIIKSSWAKRARALFSQPWRLFLGNVDPRRSGSPTRRSSIMSYDRASRLHRQSRPRIERPPRARAHVSRRAFFAVADVNYKLPIPPFDKRAVTMSSSVYCLPNRQVLFFVCV